jgi:hypothetical protein
MEGLMIVCHCSAGMLWGIWMVRAVKAIGASGTVEDTLARQDTCQGIG